MIGNSEYFAYAKDKSHPSRHIAPEDDAPGKPQGRPTLELMIAFPLHAAVEEGDNSVLSVIQRANISRVHDQDDYGHTPLHIAAKGGWFLSTTSLLQRSTNELFVQNAYGLTPLGELKETILAVEEMGREAMAMTPHRDLRLLDLSSRPLACMLQELMDIISKGSEQALDADVVQRQVNAKIKAAVEAFQIRWSRS